MSGIAMLIPDILTITMIENDIIENDIIENDIKCLVYKVKISKILVNVLTDGMICSIIL